MMTLRSIPLAGALLLAACQTQGAATSSTAPIVSAEKSASAVIAAPANTARGEAVFKDRCKDCHEPPAGDAPDRAAMAKHTPAQLRDILKTGAMQPMAEGLSDADINELISVLIKPPA